MRGTAEDSKLGYAVRLVLATRRAYSLLGFSRALQHAPAVNYRSRAHRSGLEDARRRIRWGQSDIDMRSAPPPGGCATSDRHGRTHRFPSTQTSACARGPSPSARGELPACDSIKGGLDVKLPRDRGTQRV